MSLSVRDRDVRPDIQVLRAFAVGVVVVGHLFPVGRLGGGYVGVDIFFVISGFLITAHLVERVPTNVSGLLDFWGRRVRRLLPASLTVLTATAVAGWLWLPEAQWSQTAVQIRAAATYWVNWQLASTSVDYFAAGTPATPVQHYWSLAVEEQFYLVWPVLLLGLTWLGWRLRQRRWLYFAGLLVVVGVSLWWSIVYTRQTPAAAYFVSTTRGWELGVGGLLAVANPVVTRVLATRVGGRARIPLAYAGWLLMVAAVVRFTSSTPIPGWHATVPVAGALLVIAANAPLDWYPVHMLQWLGDHSYSIYLWHWPLLVIEPLALQSTRGYYDNAAIIGATLVLAALTKRFVEDPVRHRGWWHRFVPTYAMGAAGMAVVIALATVWIRVEDNREEAYRRHVAEMVALAQRCFGAAAIDPDRNCGRRWLDGTFVPQTSVWEIGVVSAEEPGLNIGKCNSEAYKWTVIRCDAGNLSSPVTVVLAGNSHAFQWLEAVWNIVEAEQWHLVTYYATGCPLADIPRSSFTDQMIHCSDWEQTVLRNIVQLKPTLVITSNLAYQPRYNGWFGAGFGRAQFVDGYAAAYTRLSRAGIRTLVINDIPAPAGGEKADTTKVLNADPRRCLDTHPRDYSPCSAPRSDWEYADPAMDAAKRIGAPAVTSVDLNNYICAPTFCDAVVGGVRVRADFSHLTATYVHTLTPYLRPALMGAIAGK